MGRRATSRPALRPTAVVAARQLGADRVFIRCRTAGRRIGVESKTEEWGQHVKGSTAAVRGQHVPGARVHTSTLSGNVGICYAVGIGLYVAGRGRWLLRGIHDVIDGDVIQGARVARSPPGGGITGARLARGAPHVVGVRRPPRGFSGAPYRPWRTPCRLGFASGGGGFTELRQRAADCGAGPGPLGPPWRGLEPRGPQHAASYHVAQESRGPTRAAMAVALSCTRSRWWCCWPCSSS